MSSSSTTGTVTAVMVGAVKPMTGLGGRTVDSAIDKQPVDKPIRVHELGLDADECANPLHGGVDQAVYAYASEDTAWWERELDRTIHPGLFGENLQTHGIDVSGAVIGERWRVGDVVFQVTQPRMPCGKFAAVMGDKAWLRRFNEAWRHGAYLRVVQPGTLSAGATVQVIHTPAHGVTIEDLAKVADRQLPGDSLPEVPELTDEWRRIVARR